MLVKPHQYSRKQAAIDQNYIIPLSIGTRSDPYMQMPKKSKCVTILADGYAKYRLQKSNFIILNALARRRICVKQDLSQFARLLVT